MAAGTLPQSRAERLIAACRVVLAVASLVAIYVDPLEPAHHVTTTYLLLAVYTLYAACVAFWNFAAQRYDERLPLVTHSVDLLFFTVINYLTEGPTSPFFVYFVFSVVCSILRFGRRGTIATVVLAAVAFFTSAVYGAEFGRGDFELNRFIIRSVYLGVVGAIVVYLAEYHQRFSSDLHRIALWRRTDVDSRDRLVEQLLTEAAAIVKAPRVLLAYKAEELHASFLFEAANEEGGSVREVGRIAVDGDETSSLLHYLRDRVGHHSVVEGRFVGDTLSCRLYFLDRRDALEEDVALASVVATIVGTRLEHFHLTQRLRRGAVAEERVRVARDLHDSLLQSLTAATLQLRRVQRALAADHAETAETIADVHRMIVADQTELRWFIDQLQAEESPRREVTLYDLQNRFATLVQRYRTHWGLHVDLRVAGEVSFAPAAVQFEIYSIVSEAVANAAKHAAAHKVMVDVEMQRESVRIRVTDDGNGFPFEGRYCLEELMRLRRGPVTLKDRVASLDGELLIDTNGAGTSLDISIPLVGKRLGLA